MSIPVAAAADAFDPLPTHNRSPLVQIFGLPPPDSARVLAPGARRFRLTLEASNHFFQGENGAERLVLDGETHRTGIALSYGGAGAEWGIEVPYVTHGGGFLDEFIDRWHDFFGLPDGGRPAVPRDRLHYSYERGGVERLRLQETAAGLGDVRLLAGWSLPTATPTALRASLKLPTGDAAQLLGSGAADLALWVVSDCSEIHCPGSWRWNASGGVLLLGRGDVLPEQQRRFVAFGSAGIGWRAWGPVVLKSELRSHTAFYDDSALAPLADAAFLLILGGTWKVSKATMLDVSATEDLRVSTGPDISLLVSLQAKF